MQAGVVSLWSLLEVCRAQADAAPERWRAAVEVCEWVHGEGGFALVVEDGALTVGGLPVVGGVDTFAAVHGLRSFLRDYGIRAVRFAADVAAEAVERWASHVVEGTLPAQWPVGVQVVLSREPVLPDEPVARVDRSAAAGLQSDSRLRAVFLQHSLIAGLPQLVGVDPVVAKAIVQGVVDRLLQLPRGLEPLMLLQQDADLLRRSTAVAVFSALFAHHAGWPKEQLADLGVAGLLHDIGAIVDAEAPGASGFRWLLERGDDDCWLRCALVARRWRQTRDGADAAADLRGAVGLVRLAVAASGAEDLPGCRRRLMGAAEGGAVPIELVAAAQDALS